MAPRRGRITNDSLFLCFSAAYGAVTGLTICCSHRNRLGTWSNADPGKRTAAKPGTDNDILVDGELGTLVHTEARLTGTVWTYLEADEIGESGLGRLNNHLRVKIRTWGGSHTYEAMRQVAWEFDRV